ncbi:MAG: DUF3488 and transglutaminase-like domain-containing protein [Synergistaceae bacterium]|jgi:transglutaminase-like putative cysteine protease|nr:DUF3488 and transglutaminase-like domain-containing protein [Synergistaceae bacterium]
MPSRVSGFAPSGSGRSLKSLLNLTALACALLSFFMGQEVIEPVYAFSFLTVLGFAVFLEWKNLPHPPRLLVNLSTVAVLLTIFTHVRRTTVVESFMESVLLMTAIKMLEKKESRDYVQVAGLTLAAVIAYAMLSVEKTFILYCFGATFFCTLVLILSAWFSREPAARLTGGDLKQVCLRACALFGMMLPLSLLLFYAMPRTASPIFGIRGQYGTAATGFADELQLGDAAAIQNNNRLAFRAVMEPLPENRTPYWRGRVLDVFSERMWVAGRGRRERAPFIPESAEPRIAQEIFLEPGNRGFLFTLDQPVYVSGADVADLGDGVYAYTGRNAGRRLQYEVSSALSYRMKPLHSNFNRQRTLMLPPRFIPRLWLVVSDLTRGMTDEEKRTAILSYLSPPAFTYALEGLPSNPQNALEQFIFETKRGNCEYFASAMGVMLRMAGVPSRLVSGYRGGVYNDVGGYYIVQEDRAHVWVEAWDGEVSAWVRCDPTPVRDSMTEDMFGALAFYLDMMDYQWSKLVVNYNWEMQVDLLRGLREILRNPKASLTPTRDGMRRLGAALSVPAALLAGGVAVGMLFYFLRVLRSRRPEIVLLRRFLSGMKRQGYVRQESEGLETFLARVDDGKLRFLALPFVRRFEDVYFGGEPLDPEIRKAMRSQIAKIFRYRKS